MFAEDLTPMLLRMWFNPELTLPLTSTIVRDMDLHLTNANFLTDFARPMLPNIIPIGGLQLRKPNPLPKVCSSAYGFKLNKFKL